jgi:hypothetical protein
VTEFYESAQLREHNCMAKVEIRSGRIHAQFDAQRPPFHQGLFEPRAQILLAVETSRTIAYHSELPFHFLSDVRTHPAPVRTHPSSVTIALTRRSRE